MTQDLSELRERYASFVEERDWVRYETPKNLSMAISIEASELAELFLWHDNVSPERVREDSHMMANVEEELADVVIYCLGMANRLDIDLLEAVSAKLDANEERFDAEESARVRESLERWQR